MWYIVVSIIALGIAAAGAGWREGRKRADEGGGDAASLPATRPAPEACCGLHDVCEHGDPTVASGREAEYYDDEELDAYRGVAPGEYSETAADKFREVLYTMKEPEVAGWIRSLQTRGIRLPDMIEDEVFMIMCENKP
jgi:hypothetical protein